MSRYGEHRLGVLLYGPPAAGKDTVTAALGARSPGFRQFERLKVGSGKSTGYRMGSAAQLAALEQAGDVVYANARYGNTYVVDRAGLDDTFAVGVPVVHLGQVAGVRAVASGYRAHWVSVLLWCSRETTRARSKGRGDADTQARLDAWDATRADLEHCPAMAWDLTISTEDHSPDAAALLIDRLLLQRAGAAQV